MSVFSELRRAGWEVEKGKVIRWEWWILTFPGASMAPPMTTTSLTFKNVSGS